MHEMRKMRMEREMSAEIITAIGQMPRIAYTTTEAASMLSISRSTLYALAKQGAIVPVKLGSATRWRHDDLIRLASGRPASPTTTASSADAPAGIQRGCTPP